jgi:hypothetical protein
MVPAVVLTAVLAAAAEQRQQLGLTQSAPSSALMAMIAGALARTPAEASARLDWAPAVLALKLATTG